ncbi:MAG: ammonia channel protein, partial [Desulfurivibrionaceae bacterium]
TAVNAAGKDGLFFGNPQLLGILAMDALTTIAYSVVVTFIILKVVDLVIGLRVSAEEEEQGLDLTQHSEIGYSL